MLLLSSSKETSKGWPHWAFGKIVSSRKRSGVALCKLFCCKPTSLESLTEEEHLVAGNFLLPYISSLQKSLHNATPLLFRLDTIFPNAQWGQPFEVVTC